MASVSFVSPSRGHISNSQPAGQSVPESIDGQSFSDLLKDPSATDSWRKNLLYEYYWEPQFPQTPTMFCLRGSRFKLIQYHGIWDTDELYDILNDPRETRNLIGEPTQQKRVAEMRLQLYQQLKETGGLAIPLGFKRNHGSNQRSATGSKRAKFPDELIHGPAPGQRSR